MKKHWSDEYLEMIKDCEARESKLSDWEVSFLDSISTQIENNKILSVKQIEVLDRIWECVTKNG